MWLVREEERKEDDLGEPLSRLPYGLAPRKSRRQGRRRLGRLGRLGMTRSAPESIVNGEGLLGTGQAIRLI